MNVKSKKDIEYVFYRLMRNEISIKEFEKLIYDCAEIENVIGEDFYFTLINLDYRDKFVIDEVKKLIYPLIPYNIFEKERLENILHDIIEKKCDLVEVLEQLYYEYCDGYVFLRYLGMSYISYCLDEIPKVSEKDKWNEQSFIKKRQLLDDLYIDIVDEAKRILKYLQRQEILITSEYEYEDNRKYEDQIESHSFNQMCKQKKKR